MPKLELKKPAKILKTSASMLKSDKKLLTPRSKEKTLRPNASTLEGSILRAEQVKMEQTIAITDFLKEEFNWIQESVKLHYSKEINISDFN